MQRGIWEWQAIDPVLMEDLLPVYVVVCNALGVLFVLFSSFGLGLREQVGEKLL